MAGVQPPQPDRCQHLPFDVDTIMFLELAVEGCSQAVLRGSSSRVDCPFSVYQRFCSCPSCPLTFSSSEHQMQYTWRTHLNGVHQTDLGVLQNLVRDLQGAAHADWLSQPADKRTYLKPVDNGAPKPDATPQLLPSLACPLACGVADLAPGVNFAAHMVLWHLPELQAVAAVRDCLVASAITQQACPFRHTSPAASACKHRTIDDSVAAWWEHMHQHHMYDVMATTLHMFRRVELEYEHLVSTLQRSRRGPRPLICPLPACDAALRNPNSLLQHLALHLRHPHVHPPMVQELLVCARSVADAHAAAGAAAAKPLQLRPDAVQTTQFQAVGAAKGPAAGVSKDQSTGRAASKGAALLACPFPACGGSGVEPSARFQSVEDLQQHVHEVHGAAALNAWGALCRVASMDTHSGMLLCPIREVVHAGSHASMQDAGATTGRRQHYDHASADIQGVQPHMAYHRSAQDLVAHLHTHHTPGLLVMAAFAQGLCQEAASCPACPTASRLQPALSPDTALQHLLQAHPSQMLQMLHCLQLATQLSPQLAGKHHSSSSAAVHQQYSNTVPVGGKGAPGDGAGRQGVVACTCLLALCKEEVRGVDADAAALGAMMHVAQAHGSELWQLSRSAAAEAVAPGAVPSRSSSPSMHGTTRSMHGPACGVGSPRSSMSPEQLLRSCMLSTCSRSPRDAGSHPGASMSSGMHSPRGTQRSTHGSLSASTLQRSMQRGGATWGTISPGALGISVEEQLQVCDQGVQASVLTTAQLAREFITGYRPHKAGRKPRVKVDAEVQANLEPPAPAAQLAPPQASTQASGAGAAGGAAAGTAASAAAAVHAAAGKPHAVDGQMPGMMPAAASGSTVTAPGSTAAGSVPASAAGITPALPVTAAMAPTAPAAAVAAQQPMQALSPGQAAALAAPGASASAPLPPHQPVAGHGAALASPRAAATATATAAAPGLQGSQPAAGTPAPSHGSSPPQAAAGSAAGATVAATSTPPFAAMGTTSSSPVSLQPAAGAPVPPATAAAAPTAAPANSTPAVATAAAAGAPAPGVVTATAGPVAGGGMQRTLAPPGPGKQAGLFVESSASFEDGLASSSSLADISLSGKQGIAPTPAGSGLGNAVPSTSIAGAGPKSGSPGLQLGSPLDVSAKPAAAAPAAAAITPAAAAAPPVAVAPPGMGPTGLGTGNVVNAAVGSASASVGASRAVVPEAAAAASAGPVAQGMPASPAHSGSTIAGEQPKGSTALAGGLMSTAPRADTAAGASAGSPGAEVTKGMLQPAPLPPPALPSAAGRTEPAAKQATMVPTGAAPVAAAQGAPIVYSPPGVEAVPASKAAPGSDNAAAASRSGNEPTAHLGSPALTPAVKKPGLEAPAAGGELLAEASGLGSKATPASPSKDVLPKSSLPTPPGEAVKSGAAASTAPAAGGLSPPSASATSAPASSPAAAAAGTAAAGTTAATTSPRGSTSGAAPAAAAAPGSAGSAKGAALPSTTGPPSQKAPNVSSLPDHPADYPSQDDVLMGTGASIVMPDLSDLP